MIRRSIETLAAGCAVYVLMAACSGTGGGPAGQQSASAGMAQSGGHDGQGGVSAGATAAAGMAGLLDPVAGASAQVGGAPGGVCDCPDPYVPPEPVVVEAECEQVEGSPLMWAEAAFPGMAAQELAPIVAVIKYPAGLYNDWPPGYTQLASTVLVTDGAVAVGCGAVATPATYAESVTFILR
jgi:hypothetical protein